MQEAVVAEMRAQRLDLDARRKFVTPDMVDEPIMETRQLFYDYLRPDEAAEKEFFKKTERSAQTLEAAAAAEQFDVG